MNELRERIEHTGVAAGERVAPIASMRHVRKEFRDVTALDDVTFELTPGRIYGLLGRNGAGKTTIMQILAGQQRESSGQAAIFGQAPFENRRALDGLVFVRESQCYPDDYKVKHVIAAASHLLSNWDAEFAEQLLDEFSLPRNRKVKKLSRGMTSAVGIVIGLAARAPLTFFDEPYLGLDAVARDLFYRRLLADYAEHPRTVVLSTHLIDEVADLIEHVVLIDRGRVVLDEDADALRSRAVVVSGPVRTVEAFTSGFEVLHSETLGNFTRATVGADLGDADRAHAADAGLDLSPVSLQQLIVHRTNAPREEYR